MTNYSDDLDFDEQAKADLCGVSIGWVQTPEEYTGEQQVRASCRHCDIVLEITWKSPQDEREVKSRLWENFKTKAKEAGCQHVHKYEDLEKPGAKPHIEGAAMLKFWAKMKKEGWP